MLYNITLYILVLYALASGMGHTREVMCTDKKCPHSKQRGDYGGDKREGDVTHTNNLSLSPRLPKVMPQCIARNSLVLDIRLQVEWLVLK